MKKFVVLMLVLGMASLANAALLTKIVTHGADVIVPDGLGQYAVQPGWQINLSLSALSTSKVVGMQSNLLTDNGRTGAITGVGVASFFDQGQVGMEASAFDAFLVSNGLPAMGLAAGDWAWLNAFSASTTANFAGGTFMTIAYTVGDFDQGNRITINGAGLQLEGVFAGENYVADKDGQQVMPSFVLTPEPATLAILGLGALLLRRK